MAVTVDLEEEERDMGEVGDYDINNTSNEEFEGYDEIITWKDIVCLEDSTRDGMTTYSNADNSDMMCGINCNNDDDNNNNPMNLVPRNINSGNEKRIQSITSHDTIPIQLYSAKKRYHHDNEQSFMPSSQPILGVTPLSSPRNMKQNKVSPSNNTLKKMLPNLNSPRPNHHSHSHHSHRGSYWHRKHKGNFNLNKIFFS